MDNLQEREAEETLACSVPKEVLYGPVADRAYERMSAYMHFNKEGDEES